MQKLTKIESNLFIKKHELKTVVLTLLSKNMEQPPRCTTYQ